MEGIKELEMLKEVDGKTFLFGKKIQIVEDKKDPLDEIKENNKFQNFRENVPKMFWNSTLDNYKTESESEKLALEESRNLIKRITAGDCNELLMFWGNYGTGKTHLGCSLIREIGGAYITSFNLCVEYECCSDFRSKQNRVQMLKKYTQEKLLVIDEIGRGKDTVENEIIPYIVNSRYEELLPTVLITNMTKDGLCKKVGLATYDRLKQVCKSVEFNGKSRRLGLRNV